MSLTPLNQGLGRAYQVRHLNHWASHGCCLSTGLTWRWGALDMPVEDSDDDDDDDDADMCQRNMVHWSVKGATSAARVTTRHTRVRSCRGTKWSTPHVVVPSTGVTCAELDWWPSTRSTSTNDSVTSTTDRSRAPFVASQLNVSCASITFLCYAGGRRVVTLRDDARLTSVCQFGIEVGHVTRGSDTTFKVRRSKVNLQGWQRIVAASSTACCNCTGIRGLMRGMATLPQGNQELLVVKDKVGRPLAICEMWYFPLKCFDTVDWATGSHPACKKLGVGLLVVMIWLELCTTYSFSCHHHFHHP